MKGLALEYVFRMMILLVTVVVIVSLIVKFSNDIQGVVKGFVCKFFPCEKKECKTEVKSLQVISSRDIINHARGCLAKNMGIPPIEQKSCICYILTADSWNTRDLQSTIPEDLAGKLKINTDFSKPVVVVEYVDPGGFITVRPPS